MNRFFVDPVSSRPKHMIWIAVMILVACNHSIVHAQDAVDSSSSATWPPVVQSMEIETDGCTAFAPVPGENRCLLGTVEGRILSVALPEGKIRVIAQHEHSVCALAVDPTNSKLAVVSRLTKDSSLSALVTVMLVPLAGGEPVIVDQRQINKFLHANLHWSPTGDYLGIQYIRHSETAVGWMMVDASEPSVIHEASVSDSGSGSCLFGNYQTMAFSGPDRFFAFVKRGTRKSSLALFQIENNQDSTSEAKSKVCRRLDIAPLAGGFETLFGADEYGVSVLLRSFPQLANNIVRCQWVGHQLQTQWIFQQPTSSLQHVAFSTTDTTRNLFTFTSEPRLGQANVLVGNKICLERLQGNRFEVLSSTEMLPLGEITLRVDSIERYAVHFGQFALDAGRVNIIDLGVSTSESPYGSSTSAPQSVRSESYSFDIQQENHHPGRLHGDFCGDGQQFIAIVNVMAKHDRKDKRINKSILRVWTLPR